MGADSQPISTAQPKAPSPPRILVGQQLFAAQWHQHSTVQEGGTTATLIPGAHAGDTACGDSQSLNPFLIFQIHLFPLGKKKHSLQRARTNLHHGEGKQGEANRTAAPKSYRSAMQSHALQTCCRVGNAARSHHTAQKSSRAFGTFRARLPCGEYSLRGWVFLVVWGFLQALCSSEGGRKHASHPTMTWDVLTSLP